MKGGNKTSLLVGCNYPNTPYELKGCVNDVHAMRDVILKRFNFDPQHVELITDEPGSPKMPTRADIMAGLVKMVKAAKQGDVLLFHFSGHGVEADMKPGGRMTQSCLVISISFMVGFLFFVMVSYLIIADYSYFTK